MTWEPSRDLLISNPSSVFNYPFKQYEGVTREELAALAVLRDDAFAKQYRDLNDRWGETLLSELLFSAVDKHVDLPLALSDIDRHVQLYTFISKCVTTDFTMGDALYMGARTAYRAVKKPDPTERPSPSLPTARLDAQGLLRACTAVFPNINTLDMAPVNEALNTLTHSSVGPIGTIVRPFVRPFVRTSVRTSVRPVVRPVDEDFVVKVAAAAGNGVGKVEELPNHNAGFLMAMGTLSAAIFRLLACFHNTYQLLKFAPGNHKEEVYTYRHVFTEAAMDVVQSMAIVPDDVPYITDLVFQIVRRMLTPYPEWSVYDFTRLPSRPLEPPPIDFLQPLVAGVEKLLRSPLLNVNTTANGLYNMLPQVPPKTFSWDPAKIPSNKVILLVLIACDKAIFSALNPVSANLMDSYEKQLCSAVVKTKTDAYARGNLVECVDRRLANVIENVDQLDQALVDIETLTHGWDSADGYQQYVEDRSAKIADIRGIRASLETISGVGPAEGNPYLSSYPLHAFMPSQSESLNTQVTAESVVSYYLSNVRAPANDEASASGEESVSGGSSGRVSSEKPGSFMYFTTAFVVAVSVIAGLVVPIS